MTWFQVWFWVTIIIALAWWVVIRWPEDEAPESDVDRLHESTVRIIENGDGT